VNDAHDDVVVPEDEPDAHPISEPIHDQSSSSSSSSSPPPPPSPERKKQRKQKQARKQSLRGNTSTNAAERFGSDTLDDAHDVVVAEDDPYLHTLDDDDEENFTVPSFPSLLHPLVESCEEAETNKVPVAQTPTLDGTALDEKRTRKMIDLSANSSSSDSDEDIKVARRKKLALMRKRFSRELQKSDDESDHKEEDVKNNKKKKRCKKMRVETGERVGLRVAHAIDAALSRERPGMISSASDKNGKRVGNDDADEAQSSGERRREKSGKKEKKMAIQERILVAAASSSVTRKKEEREPSVTGIRWIDGKQGSHYDKWVSVWLEKDPDDPNRMVERTKSFRVRKFLSENVDYAKAKELAREAAIKLRDERNQSNPHKSHKQSGARGVIWRKAKCAWQAQIEASRTKNGEVIITTKRKFFKPSDFKDEEDIDDEVADIRARDAAIKKRRAWEARRKALTQD